MEGGVFEATPFWDSPSHYENGMLITGKALLRYIGDAVYFTVPSGVETVTRLAFQDAPNLRSVTLPDTVTAISSYAFYGCTKLEAVVIPSSVKSVGSRAFAESYELSTLYFIGTQAQFQSINVDNEWNGNGLFLAARVEYCENAPVLD